MTTPVVSPIVTTYGSRTPYITPTEYANAPTAVDITNLVPGGTWAQQTQALADTIARASSWADELVFQVLAATVDTAYGRYRVRRDGTIRMPLPFKPVLEVRSISVGSKPSTLTALGSFADVVIFPHGSIEFPVLGAAAYTAPSPYGFLGGGGVRVGDYALVQVTYVNGWPNTLTGAASVAGATSLPVTSGLGIYPGTPLTVYDGASTEQVTVASTYVTGTLNIPLAAPLVYAHPAGVSVSNLPPKVKQATISLTSALIRQRGTDSIELATIGAEPSKELPTEPGGMDDVAIAVDLLASLRRAW